MKKRKKTKFKKIFEIVELLKRHSSSNVSREEARLATAISGKDCANADVELSSYMYNAGSSKGGLK